MTSLLYFIGAITLKKVTKLVPVWLAYTIIFVGIVACSFGALRLTGQTTIWSLDGIAQHYPILTQFYRILHGTAHQSLFGWSWNLGLGADQMTTFAYYVVGDPFSYLIALFPADKLELGYQLLTILRLYVVGLAFLAFAKQFRLNRGGALTGALIYTFNGYAFYVSYHHPFFLLPLIFFPLLCLAIERIYQGHSFGWLALLIGLVLICNVYFAYVLAIGAVIFAIIRYIDLAYKHRLNVSFLKALGSFIASGVIGVLTSAVILLPSALAMLHSSRSGGSIFANGLKLYPPVYYLNLPDALINSNGTIYYWVVIGTSGLSLLGIIWMMRHFRQNLAVNITLIFILLGLLVPAVAATFNVMSTPSNRWVLLAHLVFAFIAARFVDQIHTLEPADFTWFLGVSTGLLILVWATNGFSLKLTTNNLIIYVIYFLFITLLAYGLLQELYAWQLKIGLLALVCLNVITTGLGFYSANFSASTENELPAGTASRWAKTYFDAADRYLNRADQSFYRTSTTSDYYTSLTVGNNIPMLLNTHTISSYYSVQNGYLNTFNKQLQNSQNAMNNPTDEVDDRTTMNSLLGVKYLFARQDNVANQAAAPYGFTPVKNKAGHIAVFTDQPVYGLGNGTGTVLLKNQYALPLAYTQTKQLTDTTYNQLNALTKERALLSGTHTSKTVSGVTKTSATTVGKSVPYKVNVTSEPVTTLPQAITYRLQHNTSKSLSAAVSTKGLMDDPKEALKYAAATGLDDPSTRVEDLLAQNQLMLTNNAEANKNGLKQMTSDVLGQQQTYQLQIKRPKSTRNTELYLDLSGIQASFPSTKTQLAKIANQSALAGTPNTKGDKLNNWREITQHPYFDEYYLNVNTSKSKTTFDQLGINNMSDYEPKHHLLINLGYSSKARQMVNLTFSNATKLSFKNVKLIAVPFGKSYQQQTRAIQVHGLNNLNVTNNTVTGNTNRKQASVLTTSIPYSTGWHLTVDGQKKSTQIVNSGFVGASLTKGPHHVRLVYETPGLKLGKWLSIGGGLLLIIASLWQFVWQRRQQA
ncbi:integral membrane protein [Secundilactobacillus similis DSM 23365 = JCM 2765]|uniref:Integral membrane protein n=2 Tax=Secundilactobacillus similis TaxID=414682 RepID=A0A0R2F063_9LACO|nr:integral membrane protein [Secundilactobacillus similis DSM 23365 = JCM 2765]